MWLLDANIDIHLAAFLTERGIACDTAANRGWKALSNGKLVAAATASDFNCLLTRALPSQPAFAVVLIGLPQKHWPEYQERFTGLWASSPVKPHPGRLAEGRYLKPQGPPKQSATST